MENSRMPDRRETGKGRLFCLDLLRGLDMMLLLVAGPLVMSYGKAWGLPAEVLGQFKHGWECFTLWDIIMPLFIFMCGAAMPLALPKRMTDGRARWPYWRHVLKRVALLWVCGMVVQGNLLSLDPLKIGPFSNTLQAIAVGYAATAALMLLPRVWMRCAVTAALFAAYALLLHAGGDYTPEGNFTAIVERRVFAAVLPAGSIWLKVGYYTWIVPSIMFTAMTLCGFHATEILRSAFSPKRFPFISRRSGSFRPPLPFRVYGASCSVQVRFRRAGERGDGGDRRPFRKRRPVVLGDGVRLLCACFCRQDPGCSAESGEVAVIKQLE